MHSFFILLKNDSATALSQQLPRRLMLGCRQCARQKRCQSSLPYCEPWTECPVTGCVGLRRNIAISNASSTPSRASVDFIDQSMTLRECRSMTTAR